MGCAENLREGTRDEVKAIIENARNGKTNVALTLVSKTPIGYSSENLRKIEQILNGAYGNARRRDEDTPGVRGYCFSAQHDEPDGIHAVFVDISCEKRDDGMVSLYAPKNHVEKVKEKLENALGIEFENA
jgi:hypothetical protein